MLSSTVHSASVAQRCSLRSNACCARTARTVRRPFICRASAAPVTEKRTCILDKLGGQQALEVAVDKFYDRVVNDDRIKHFFEGVDMKKQRKHQVAFLSFALGGKQYTGRSMAEAHKGLQGLNDIHFDAVVENLAATLQEMGVSDDLIGEAGAIVESTRTAVLNRPVSDN